MKRPPRDMLGAALFYADELGWIVFPCRPDQKKSYKAARFSNGQRWGATNKPAVIRRDFKRWSKANIGIPTGPQNGFWVLEADTLKGHGFDGIASLRRLERQHGRLPRTLVAMSPSGSLHYYYRWPKRGLIGNSASKIAPGIDVRGEGGMVVAPPSVKAGVGEYRFLNWGTPIADAPKWLLDLVVRKERKGKQKGKANAAKTNGGTSNPFYECADVRLIETALDVIQQDCAALGKWPYTVWFEVGCALHSELGDELCPL